MLDQILSLDLSLFYAINKELSNSLFDMIMPVITNTITWIPIITAFMLYQFFKCGTNGRLCIIALVLGVIICDQTSSNLIKNLVMRPRPCHTLLDLNLLVHCGAGKSFPSSHASNSMMVVTVISLFYRNHKYWLPFIAISVGFSRIYVGVHYPLDVFCGWVLGVAIGFFIYNLTMYCYNKFNKQKL